MPSNESSAKGRAVISAVTNAGRSLFSRLRARRSIWAERSVHVIWASRIGEFQQVAGDLARAAADVEDRLHAAEVELARADQPAAELNVQRHLARRGEQRAFAAAVHVLDLVAILVL